VKMSFKMGGLYPTCAMDCVPGDKVKISTETMLRFAPLIAPVMHKVNVTTHYFFVPNRILWPNWEQWITGNLDVTPPYSYYAGEVGEELFNIPVKSLGDYLGLPTQASYNGYLFPNKNAQIFSPFSIAAYNKIWNEYYRDQNLQTALDDSLTDGLNAINTAFVHITFTGANKPAVLTGQTEATSAPITNYKYLLMPMRYSS